MNRILDHRVLRGGTTEYEIEWDGKKLDGTPWPLEWKAADELTPDLIDVYTSKRAHGVAPYMVTHDAALVYEEVQRKMAERHLINRLLAHAGAHSRAIAAGCSG